LLLGREVVVQRGDVHAHLACDLAGAQPFEAVLGDLVVRGAHQRTAAILLRRRLGHGAQLNTRLVRSPRVLRTRLLFSWVMRLRIFRLLMAVGLGAAAAYLLDPDSW